MAHPADRAASAQASTPPLPWPRVGTSAPGAFVSRPTDPQRQRHLTRRRGPALPLLPGSSPISGSRGFYADLCELALGRVAASWLLRAVYRGPVGVVLWATPCYVLVHQQSLTQAAREPPFAPSPPTHTTPPTRGPFSAFLLFYRRPGPSIPGPGPTLGLVSNLPLPGSMIRHPASLFFFFRAISIMGLLS